MEISSTRLESVRLIAQKKLTLLQIEESRKAIQQAETVRRLTILAFIFIPLSTVCGFFGMNISGIQVFPCAPSLGLELAYEAAMGDTSMCEPGVEGLMLNIGLPSI